MRKGYVYALEGVIASLLVLMYLGNIVTVPETTNWDTSDLNTRSGDIVRALHESGTMEDAIVNNDPQRLDAALQAMGAGLDYNMWISGLPRPTIEMRVIATDDIIEQAATTASGNTREGTSDIGYPFEVRDDVDEAFFKYDAVYFDYDEDGTYDNGPCNFGSLLKDCTTKPNDLQDEIYQIGYINDTVTIFDMTRYQRLAERDEISMDHLSLSIVFAATELRETQELTDTDLTTNGDWDEGSFDLDGGLTIQLNVTTDRDMIFFNESSGFHGPYIEGDEVQLVGTFYEITSLDPVRLEPQNELVADILLAENHDPVLFQTHNDTLTEFVSDGNTLIERADLSGMDRQAFNQTIRREMGVEWIDIPIQEGTSSGSYFADADPGTPASFIDQYYPQVGITIQEASFEDIGGNIEQATFSIGGDSFIAEVDTANDEVGFAPEGQAVTTWHDRGDRVAIGSNLVKIKHLMPLELEPQPPTRFADMRGPPVIADSTILEDQNAAWDQDAASINSSGFTDENEPLEDLPSTVCNDAHRVDGLTIDQTYTVVISKVAQDPDECDDTAYTHVSFDFDGDDQSNLSADETRDGYGTEGIYLAGQMVEINHRSYRLFPEENGSWLYFERQIPDNVPAAVWSENAVQGQGGYMLTGESVWGHDTASFIISSAIRGSVERYQFTDSRVMGDSSVGASYTFAVDQTIFSPYTMDTVWWYN